MTLRIRNTSPIITTIAMSAAAAISMSASGTNPCASAWNTAFNHDTLNGETIYALAIYNGDLIAGGTFSANGEWIAKHVARWDGNAWHPLGDGVNGNVHALFVHDGSLYAGGFFTEAGGTSANRIARWDGNDWHAVGEGFNNAVMALGAWNGNLVAGGLFTHSGTIEVNRISQFDGSSWQSVGGGMDGMVLSLGTFQGELIAAGRFLDAGGATARNVARFNGSAWNPLGGSIDVYEAEGPIKPVWAMAVDSDLGLMLGGSSIYIHRTGVHPFNLHPHQFQFLTSFYSARWNGSEWIRVAPPDAVPNRIIRSLLVTDQGQLIAAGDFTRIGNNHADRIARWAGSDWQSIGHGVGGPLTTAVHDMIEYGGEIIVAGYFTDAAGLHATSIAGWKGAISAGPSDLNCDGSVGVIDLLILFKSWGPCADCDKCPADLNGDCVVDVGDLLILFDSWG